MCPEGHVLWVAAQEIAVDPNRPAEQSGYFHTALDIHLTVCDACRSALSDDDTVQRLRAQFKRRK